MSASPGVLGGLDVLTQRVPPSPGVLGGPDVRRHAGRLHLRVCARLVTSRPVPAPLVPETAGRAAGQSRRLAGTRGQRHQRGHLRAAAALRTRGHLHRQPALN